MGDRRRRMPLAPWIVAKLREPLPPCTPGATLCGGTPDGCWNHAAVDGRCYRAPALPAPPSPL